MAERKAQMCDRIACYNRRNGRECWDAFHDDGGKTYEYESREMAMLATKLSSRDPQLRFHFNKFC